YADSILSTVNTSDIVSPVAANTQISIFANVIEDYGLDFNGVYLWYDNGSGWTSVPMSLVSGNYTNATFLAYIPEVNAETTVSYFVEVMDNATNTNVSITKNYLTNFPPFIKDVTHLPAYPNGTVTVTVNANMTDSDGITSATLYYSTDGISYIPTSMSIVSGDIYNGMIPAAGAEAVVYYYVKATDANGFESSSSIYIYSIDNQHPTISIPTIDPQYPNAIESVNVSFLIINDGAIGSATLYYTYDGVVWFTSPVYFTGGLNNILFDETFP
ncbi:unnamed protein product, partial [marine sediment metagenome]